MSEQAYINNAKAVKMMTETVAFGELWLRLS